MHFLSGLLAVVLMMIPAEGFAKGVSPHKFVILIDDSGTIEHLEEWETLKHQLWSQLKMLRRSRTYKDAAITVIATSSGKNVWNGTVSDLKNTTRQQGKAKALLEATKSAENRCNDLLAAFATLDRTLKLTDERMITAVHVYIFSHLYHTGRPCSDHDEIVYPNPPPQALDAVGILTQKPSIKTVAIYGVHPTQSAVWMRDKLDGLLAWEREAGTGRQFELYVESQTQAELMNGLEGVKR